MRKYFSDLQEKAAGSGDENEKQKLDALLKFLWLYWELYDNVEGTIHGEIFESLYLLKKKEKIHNISQKFFMNEKTVYRYKIKYERLAEAVMEMSDAVEFRMEKRNLVIVISW